MDTTRKPKQQPVMTLWKVTDVEFDWTMMFKNLFLSPEFYLFACSSPFYNFTSTHIFSND